MTMKCTTSLRGNTDSFMPVPDGIWMGAMLIQGTMFNKSHFGNGRQDAGRGMLTTGLYEVGTLCSGNPVQLIELLCMKLSIRTFRGKHSQPLILYTSYIILLIGHIHQKMHTIQHKSYISPCKLQHVSAPRCPPQGVTNTMKYTLQAPTHKS